MLVESHNSFATILGCSDFRVPPELVFDVGLGELFIVRLAGNIIAEDVIGTLQYAVAHLHTPLVIVLGHEGCGAVTAAVDDMLHVNHEPSHIEALLRLIEPGLAKVDLPARNAGGLAEGGGGSQCPLVHAATDHFAGGRKARAPSRRGR